MNRIALLTLILAACAASCARGPNAGRAAEISAAEVPALISQGQGAHRLPPPSLDELERTAEELGFDDSEASFIIRMGRLAAHLDALDLEERPEQIADWVVYATMIQGELEAGAIRDLTYDRPPLRDPALLELTSFRYGPGRSLVLDDGRCWLFLSATDPRPVETLARLADQVRMEQGELPASSTIFAYRTDLLRGHIHVRQLGDLSRDQLLSERFGYVELEVSSASELGQALERIDDLTHLDRRGQAVIVGGRRFDAHRTPSVTLEDVAVLYQGSRGAGEYQDLDDREARIVESHNRLVSLLNDAADRRGPIDAAAFERAMAELAEAARIQQSHSRPRVTLTEQARAFQTLAPTVQVRLTEIRQRAQELLSRPPPTSPGFSLDPQWDLIGLRADLERLVTDPASLVALAHEQAVEGGLDAWALGGNRPNQQGAELARTVPLEAAQRFAEVVSVHLPAVQAFLGQVRALPGPTIPELPQYDQLRESFRASGDEGVLVDLALAFVQSRNQIQCARYDGSIQGTRVAMNLFYTDLVAKLWAGIDFHGSAPTEGVEGFLSVPTLEEQLGAIEVPELNRTRIWFGPRMDRIAWGSDGDALGFAHIASRVYAASSASSTPGQEAEAVGSSRQVLGWWDRHFLHVADYEPQFHLQNQVMKWSVATAWLAREGLLGDLTQVSLDRSLRFDQWLESTPDLRMGATVSLLPQDRWRGGTECLDRLASRVINHGPGSRSLIHGGVSLGSRRTLAEAHRVRPDVPPSLRRSGFRHALRGETHLVESPARGQAELLPAGEGGREARARLSTSPEVIQAARTTGRVTSGEVRVATDQHAVTSFEFEAPHRHLRVEGQRVDDGVALAPRIRRPDEARAPPIDDPAFADLFRAVTGDGEAIPEVVTSERVRALDEEQRSLITWAAAEHGHHAVQEYVALQTGRSGASPDVAANADLVQQGDRLHLRVRLEPSDIQLWDETRPLLYSEHNAARRGGETDIYSATAEVGADIYTSAAGVAHQFDLDAFPLGRVSGAPRLPSPSAVQVLDVSSRELGSARPSLIEVGEAVYHAAGSTGRPIETPGQSPPKRRLHLVGSFVRGR